MELKLPLRRTLLPWLREKNSNCLFGGHNCLERAGQTQIASSEDKFTLKRGGLTQIASSEDLPTTKSCCNSNCLFGGLEQDANSLTANITQIASSEDPERPAQAQETQIASSEDAGSCWKSCFNSNCLLRGLVNGLVCGELKLPLTRTAPRPRELKLPRKRTRARPGQPVDRRLTQNDSLHGDEKAMVFDAVRVRSERSWTGLAT